MLLVYLFLGISAFAVVYYIIKQALKRTGSLETEDNTIANKRNTDEKKERITIGNVRTIGPNPEIRQHKKRKTKTSGAGQNADTLIVGEIDNRIIQRHDAEIRYPNTIHSSYDNVRTTLGVFEDPIIVEYDGKQDVCGLFRKPISNGEYSFYFRLPEKNILINDFESEFYVHTLIYSYDEELGKYESLYHKPGDAISIEKLSKAIFYMPCEKCIYYLDYRSDYQLQIISGNSYHTCRISEDGMQLYLRYNDGTFQVLDISTGVPLLTHSGSKSVHNVKNVQPDLPNAIHFYFTVDSSKPSTVAYKYVKDHLDYLIMENEFEDDDSINIDVTIPVSDKYSIGIINYAYANMSKRYSIYGISPSGIVDIASESFEYHVYMQHKVSPKLKDACSDIVDRITEARKISHQEAIEYILENYCVYENVYDAVLSVTEDDGYFDDYTRFKEAYDEIYQSMIVTGEATPKWKSETDMYKVIKAKFPDAIYQYHDGYLLGAQSFDVYVPSEMIAFEYQGIQHYKPVELFGGEEGFEYRKKLDARKKEICSDNAITLIEWKYDEPVSLMMLKKKIKEQRPDIRIT